MSISTDVSDKRSKVVKLREKHQPVFEMLGIPQALFIPKMAYTPPGKDEKHLGFFPSELRKAEDIYTEFVSRENDPEDPERILYRLQHNPYWETEYETTHPSKANDPTSVRYLVPVAELVVIQELAGKSSVRKEREEELEIVNPETDPPYNTMTLRDYAAIQLRVPKSNKPWLNEMIKESRK